MRWNIKPNITDHEIMFNCIKNNKNIRGYGVKGRRLFDMLDIRCIG